MMKIYSTILLAMLIFNHITLANPATDSLLVLMLEAEGEKKVDLLNEMAEAVINENADDLKKYSTNALDEAKQIKYNKGIAKALLNLGIYHSIIGKCDKSIEEFQRALKLFLELDDKEGEAKAYLNLGRAFKYRGNFHGALVNYNSSLEINQLIENTKGIAKCYVNLGVLYFDLNNDTKAIEYYLQALTYKKRLNDTLGMGLIYNNIGQIFLKDEQFHKAQEYFQRANDIFKNLKSKYHMSLTSNNLSLVSLNLNNFNKALTYQKASLESAREVGDKHVETVSLLNLSNIYLKTGDLISSKKYLVQASEMAIKFKYEHCIANSNRLYGKLFFSMKKYDQSNQYLQASKHYYQKENMFKELAENYMLMANNYHEMNKNDMAYAYQQDYITLSDSINHANNNFIMENISQLHEAESKIVIYKKDKIIQETRNTILMVIIASGAIICLLLVFGCVVFIYKNKKLKATIIELDEMMIFQKDVYNSLTNNVLSSLYPLSADIAKVSNSKEYDDLNNSYLDFTNEIDKIIKDYKTHIDN